MLFSQQPLRIEYNHVSSCGDRDPRVYESSEYSSLDNDSESKITTCLAAMSVIPVSYIQ